jgi:hypothetical protein
MEYIKSLDENVEISDMKITEKNVVDVNELCRKEREKVQFVNMTDDDVENLMDKFIEYSDEGNIEWDRFNYEIFDYNYYKKRFPKFDDDIIDILVKCSKTKMYDDTTTFQEPKKYKEEDFTLTFS